MKLYYKFLFIWLLNSIIFLLANKYYPSSYVLGNAVMTPLTAAIVSGFILSLILKLAKNFSSKVGKERYKLFVYYFLINAVGVWVIARLSVVSGFGIPVFTYAFCLGFFASLGQWLLRQVFKRAKLN